jgi:small subunit ribosomal protein S18
VTDEIENEEEIEEEELEDEEQGEESEEAEEKEKPSGRETRSRGPRRSYSGRSSRGSSRGRFGRRPRVCQFCADKTKSLSYKQTDVLRRFVTDQGKIRGRRETGTCAKHQRMVARAVKRARHMALLSYAGESHR